MKIALYRSPSQGRSRMSRSRPGFNQIQLGDELLVYARPTSASQARSDRADAGERLLEVDEENLHLVIQIGSRFQQDHPDVPVIFNKGRFLVVNVDPNTAKTLAPPSGSCCY